jgi:hypothetical protein
VVSTIVFVVVSITVSVVVVFSMVSVVVSVVVSTVVDSSGFLSLLQEESITPNPKNNIENTNLFFILSRPITL